MRKLFVIVFTVALVLAPSSDACPGNGSCQRKGHQHRHGQDGHAGSGGQGKACRMDDSHEADMKVFHFLVINRDKITRTVSDIDNGVETVTESDDPEIVEKIRNHVSAMQSRLTEGRPIHMRDPLFAEIFANAKAIEMTVEETEKGVRVRETSADDHVANLIKAHAEVIEKFLENGMPEMRRNHEVPAAK